jgi:hypothetical protein
MKRVLLLLLTSLLLVSCSSFSTLVRSQVEGVPQWVYNPQPKGDQQVFVGKGEAVVLENARLEAYRDLLDQLSLFIGEDVTEQYYRELTNTSSIEAFALHITDEHQRSEKGHQTVYLLARSDAKKLESRQSSVYQEMIVREQQIVALIKEADRAYRANDDTRAITRYLEAALLSAQGPVADSKHESASLIDRATSMIKALRMTTRTIDSKRARATIQLRRRGRILSSRVFDAPIVATFTSRNSLGVHYEDQLLFNTAREGAFQFLPYNQGLIPSGTITFTVDLSQYLPRLDAAVGTEGTQTLREAIASTSLNISYELENPLLGERVLAEIQEYSIEGGRVVGGITALTAFEALMEESGIAVEQVDLEEAEVEEQLQEIASQVSNSALVYLGSVSSVREDRLGSRSIVVVSGRIRLYRIGVESPIYDTQEVEAVGSGSTIQEARQRAFERFGTIAASLCNAFLVTP